MDPEAAAAPGPPVAVASDRLRARLARPRPTIPRRAEPLLPLTSTQQGIWYDARLAPHDPAHHRTTVVSLRGPLDRDALQQALDAVVAAQSCLRTCYPVQAGVPMQRVLAPGSVPIRQVDATRDATAARAAIDAASTTVFDLEHQAPFAATLVEQGASDHQLVLALSHLAIDGPSAGLLASQLAAAYAAAIAGSSVAPPDRRARFGDWVAWRAEQQDEEVRDQQLSWWSLFLAGRSAASPLPPAATGSGPWVHGHTDQNQFAGGVAVTLSDDVVSRLRALARAESVTMNAVVMAAAATLAWEELGIDDLVVGMPVTDRDHPEVEDVVGCFMRVLPVRLRLGAGETRRELLRRTGATLNVVLDHRAVAMPEILWTVAPRDGSGHVVDVVDVFVHYRRDRDRTAGPREAAGVEFELVDVGSLDRTTTVEVRDDGVGLRVTSAMVADHLRRLADDPDRPLRAPRVERSSRACPTGSNLDPAPSGAARSAPAPGPALDATVGSLFAEAEREHAGRTAIRHGDRSVTFAELGGLGREVAEQLAVLGVGPGHTVGVRFDRGVEGIAAMLGVVLSGAAYVPMDDQAPPARIQTVVDDARLSALLSPSGIERLSPGALPLPVDVGPSAPVYVMYTSGSTGRPKGVVVHHRAVIQLVCDHRYVGYCPDDVVAYTSNPTFDTATLEVWGALLNGACLAVVTPDVLVDPDALEVCIAEDGITALHPTTSLFHALVRRRPGLFSGLRLLSVGGEAADPSLVRAVVAAGPPTRFVNDYGPTETTTSAAYYEITEVPEAATSVPIGRPLAAGSLHVLDGRGRPVPAGVPGELAIGGDGVALGYLDRPGLTAERFVPDPFSILPGARLYLTGDMVYARLDGLIEFLGRVDTQVKVRGFRVELGEIESALTSRGDIDQAAVIVWRDGGDASIVAYAVPAEGQSLDESAIVAGLRSVVPAYMVPDRIVTLDELPVTPNGKVDRRRAAVAERACRGRRLDRRPEGRPRGDARGVVLGARSAGRPSGCGVLRHRWALVAGSSAVGRGRGQLRRRPTAGRSDRGADAEAAHGCGPQPRSRAPRRRPHRTRCRRRRRPDPAPDTGRGRRPLCERLPHAGPPPAVDRKGGHLRGPGPGAGHHADDLDRGTRRLVCGAGRRGPTRGAARRLRSLLRWDHRGRGGASTGGQGPDGGARGAARRPPSPAATVDRHSAPASC